MNVTSRVGGGARVSRADIEGKLREIRGEAGEVAESGRNTAMLAAGAVGAVVVAVAFLLGRRKGTKRTTVVEVRRL